MIPKASHVLPLMGKIRDTNKIMAVPNILVIRKGVEKKMLKYYCSKYHYDFKKTHFIAFVSSPYMYLNSYTRDIVKLWLHPFHDPVQYLSQSSKWYFLSESDFVDVSMYNSYPKKNIIWDYFYFTVGGGDGVNHKGYDVFKHILPALVGLKGVVIIYGKTNKFPKSEVRCLTKKGIKVYKKILSKETVQSIYRNSKFGLFPNITDCSPRMIPECIINNTPVLVNKDILGGWKYVNDETGMFFDEIITKKQIRDFMQKSFSPQKYYKENYGFKKSSKRFAEILSENFIEAKDFEFVYFSTHKETLKSITKE